MPIALIARGSRAAGLVVLLAVLALPWGARADDDAAVIDKLTKMNKKAVEEYENLNFEEARKILKEALDLASQSGLEKHPIKARTHVHLGVVILVGFKQREVAIKQFHKAMEIQPDIKLTKSLANPEVQEAFDEAVAGMSKEGGDGGEKPPGGETPPTGEKPPAAEPLVHTPVTRGTQGRPIPIQAVVDPSTGATKVVLAYRPEGNADYIGREMKQISPGHWAAEIPAGATAGERVTYYIEVHREDEVVTSKGSTDAPLSIVLRRPVEEPPEEDDEGPGYFLAVAVGSGFGWTTGNGEVNVLDKVNPAGFAPARLGHIAPEIGYFVKPNVLLSVQLRLQFVTGATESRLRPTDAGYNTDCGGDMICSPATYAVAGFARVTYLFGEGSFHPYVAGALGGGYIRHVAEFRSTPPTCGSNGTAVCVDTVAAGPVLLGPGGGFFYNLSPNFALSLGVSAIVGFSTFTFHIDGNLGIAAEF